MATRPRAPAPERNKIPILEVLRTEFQDGKAVLEIGSGTGQHAVFFGAELPHLTWQTSDRAENHEDIDAWLTEATDNVKPPLDLDVEQTRSVPGHYDAVFSANTAHIMSIHAVQCMFRLVGECLPGDGVFCLYGPFNIDGKFTSESNQRFDESLRAKDSHMGIRDLGNLDELAADNGMARSATYAMPSNNMLVVWRKRKT